MKLLPRLYDPKSGKITVDSYDISKVDLSSLRRQEVALFLGFIVV